MKRASVCFWLNLYSPHLSEFIASLAMKADVVVFVDEQMSAARARDGWSLPCCPNVRVEAVSVSGIGGALDGLPGDTLHVFAPRGSKLGKALPVYLRRRHLKFALMCEMPKGCWLKMLTIRMMYAWHASRLRDAEFMIAMGHRAADWYRDVGFSNVHEFAYTVPISSHQVAHMDSDNRIYRFVCVARLVKGKNHDFLLRGLAYVKTGWHLDVVGAGPLEGRLQKLAKELGVEHRVSWHGALPNAAARELIFRSDTLLLPSAYEGWGAVVNEAVAEGTRVLVSDMSGSSSLMHIPGAGRSHQILSSEEYGKVLVEETKRGPVSARERLSRMRAHELISGETMARYFLDIVNGETPVTPWMRHESH